MKAARIVVGLAISACFACAIVSRVDLASVAHALGRASLAGMALALAFAWLEIGVRAWRWRYLLSPLGRVGYSQAFGYTCIGYFANTLLPMRIGDVARAYLAATALRLPRLATLGSIVTERLIDGLVTVAIAVGLGVVVSGASRAAPAWTWAALFIAALATAVALVILMSRRLQVVGSLVPIRLRDPLGRLIQGAHAIRSLRGVCVTVAATLLAYICAVSALLAVSASVGLAISWPQAAFAMAWIALSTAIPAAPSSVGTYEFVGVSALVLLGQDPASALAVVVLLHVIVTLPVATVGLAMTWTMHLRIWNLPSDTSTSEPVEPSVEAV